MLSAGRTGAPAGTLSADRGQFPAIAVMRAGRRAGEPGHGPGAGGAARRRLTARTGGAQGNRMQMTEAFASAVTVSVPIFALAAGAEARGVRDRLRRPDQEW